jgi:hypothetical protein
VQLELDLLDWKRVRASYPAARDDDGIIAWDVFKLPRGGKKLLFPNLQHISLSAVSFVSAEKEMASAFCFRSLRSLRLRFCPGWEEFLQHVHSSERPIRLQTLELQDNIEYGDDQTTSAVSDFVEAVEGLQELFICMSSPSQSLPIWRSMHRHLSSLRKFVHHQHRIGQMNEKKDCPDLSFAMPDNAPWVNSSHNLLSGLDLECIGLCVLPQYLVIPTPQEP